MKNLKRFTIATLIVCFISCSKEDLPPIPFHHSDSYTYNDKGLDDSFFDISASLPNLNNTASTINESGGSIILPVDKNLNLNVKEVHRTVKSVKWIVNGKVIATGNNASVELLNKGIDIGVGKLNVEFTEEKSGRKHNKELKLYAFKQVNISVQITPKTNICGEVAIGITQTLTSFGNEKIGPLYMEKSIQNICSSGQNKTAGIARIPLNIYDKKTTFSIDLIEPLKSTSNRNSGFWILFFWIGFSSSNVTISPKQIYQSDSFTASATNNVSFGNFTSGNTVLTIEK